MENSLKDLMNWIRSNRKHFKDDHYKPEHIADLAIACGFDRSAVAQWQVSQKFAEVK